jgi:oligoendopeptidase F
MSPESNDPVVDEIRRIRHQISAEHDHDPTKLVAYYMELQKKYKDRLIGMDKKPERTDPPAA